MLEKPYTINFEERENYLYVYVAGDDDNYDISLQYWTEVSNKLKKTGLKKVLIYEDIKAESPLTDVFRLVSELPSIGFLGKTVAFVDRYVAHSELNEFGILVGTNRGLFAQAFNDPAEAEAWLLAH